MPKGKRATTKQASAGRHNLVKAHISNIGRKRLPRIRRK